jgi:transcriptional regulator with XRE-family HTH domain
MRRDSTFGRRLAELRAEHGLSLRQLGERAHFSRGFLWDLEAGHKLPSPASAARLDQALAAGGRLAALAAPAPHARDFADPPVLTLEALRWQVTEAVTATELSPAAVDDWEQTAIEHGRATRHSQPAALLGNIAADFAELCSQLRRRQSSSTLRSLTRVTAQLAGLMFLTLIKLDEQDAARSWARTARVAAQEAGDPMLQSWVRAQEAYVHYYSGRYGEALAVAHHAQALVGGSPCVGAVLAAALEARALGKVRRGKDARVAIGAAEAILGALDAESVTASAFGYNEAQMRFHEGNALTHLRDIEGAWLAQQRALELYPDSDYLDRALVRLDRASCLAQDGDPSEAMRYATEALVSLTDEERQGLLTVRGREVLRSLPPAAQVMPAAKDFQGLLITSAPNGADR